MSSVVVVVNRFTKYAIFYPSATNMFGGEGSGVVLEAYCEAFSSARRLSE